MIVPYFNVHGVGCVPVRGRIAVRAPAAGAAPAAARAAVHDQLVHSSAGVARAWRACQWSLNLGEDLGEQGRQQTYDGCVAR